MLYVDSRLSGKGAPMSILIERFIRVEGGATAIEYALIAGFVSIVSVAAVGGLGSAVNAKFTTVSTALK